MSPRNRIFTIFFFPYNLYSADQSSSSNTSNTSVADFADFADNNIIYSLRKEPIIAIINLQNRLDLMFSWYDEWKIKINHGKSNHLSFTLIRGIVPLFFMSTNYKEEKKPAIIVDRFQDPKTILFGLWSPKSKCSL